MLKKNMITLVVTTIALQSIVLAAPLPATDASSTPLAGSLANTPAEYLFTLSDSNKIFGLLDVTNDSDSKYFVMAKESYGRAVFDSDRTVKFDPTDENNIGYFLNTIITDENKKEWVGAENSFTHLPPSILPHINYEHVWATESGNVINSNCPEGYDTTCGVALLAVHEAKTFVARHGYHDGFASSWWFRTSHGVNGPNRGDVILRYINPAQGGTAGSISNWDANGYQHVRPVFYLNDSFFAKVKINVDTMGSHVKQTIIDNHTVDELAQIYTADELATIGFANLPVAQKVSARGSSAVSQTIKGEYTYFAPDSQAEGDTVYKWLSSNQIEGTYTAIEGANTQNYTIDATLEGKYIKFSVLPKNQSGISGYSVMSEAIGPIRTEQDVAVAFGEFSTTASTATVSIDITSKVAKTVGLLLTSFDNVNMLIDASYIPITLSVGTAIHSGSVGINAQIANVKAVIVEDNTSWKPLSIVKELEYGQVATSTSEPSIVQNINQGTLKIEGKMPSATYNNCVVATISDDDLVYANPITTSSEGSFSIEFKLDSSKLSKDYDLVINSYDNSEPLVIPFYYVNQEETQDLYDTVKDLADASTIQGLLTPTKMKVLGLDNPFFSTLPLEVCQKLATSGYTTLPELQEIAFAEIAVQALKQKATSVAVVEQVFDTYESVFDFANESAYSDYQQLVNAPQTGADSQNFIYSTFINRAFTDVAAIQENFNKAVALETLYRAPDYSVFAQLLNQHQTLLELNLSTYSALKEPNNVCINLMGRRFNSSSELLVAFNISVATQVQNEKPKPTSGSGSSGGSGGGGGGSGGSTMTIPADIPSTTPLPIGTPFPELKIFQDIESVEWAKEAIENLSNQNIISGDGDGNFRPNDNVLREEFVKVLFVAFNLPYADDVDDFLDVDADAWYYEYALGAREAGIVKGRADGSFGIGEPITRQDMAVMLYRAIVYTNKKVDSIEEIEFGDSGDIDEYARESIEYLASAKLINGVGNGNFVPLRTATRAEVAVLINKVVGGKQ